jgi:hypothetical protein
MNRHLTVRDLSGTRILADYTLPEGASLPALNCAAAMAHDRARTHPDGAVIWLAYEPVTIYRPEMPHD